MIKQSLIAWGNVVLKVIVHNPITLQNKGGRIEETSSINSGKWEHTKREREREREREGGGGDGIDDKAIKGKD